MRFDGYTAALAISLALRFARFFAFFRAFLPTPVDASSAVVFRSGASDLRFLPNAESAYDRARESISGTFDSMDEGDVEEKFDANKSFFDFD